MCNEPERCKQPSGNPQAPNTVLYAALRWCSTRKHSSKYATVMQALHTLQYIPPCLLLGDIQGDLRQQGASWGISNSGTHTDAAIGVLCMSACICNCRRSNEMIIATIQGYCYLALLLQCDKSTIECVKIVKCQRPRRAPHKKYLTQNRRTASQVPFFRPR